MWFENKTHVNKKILRLTKKKEKKLLSRFLYYLLKEIFPIQSLNIWRIHTCHILIFSYFYSFLLLGFLEKKRIYMTLLERGETFDERHTAYYYYNYLAT